jgi:hypothetical protein
MKIKQRATVEAVQYAWAAGSRVAVDPGVAAAEMQRIRQEHGMVTPELVVKAAKPEDAPRHAAFEWNDDVAARAWREEQAKYILRSLVVVYRRSSDAALMPPVRYLVNVRQTADDPSFDRATDALVEPRSYHPILSVMSEADHRRRLLRQAWRDLQTWRTRYRELETLGRVFAAIDAAAPEIESEITPEAIAS